MEQELQEPKGRLERHRKVPLVIQELKADKVLKEHKEDKELKEERV